MKLETIEIRKSDDKYESYESIDGASFVCMRAASKLFQLGTPVPERLWITIHNTNVKDSVMVRYSYNASCTQWYNGKRWCGKESFHALNIFVYGNVGSDTPAWITVQAPA